MFLINPKILCNIKNYAIYYHLFLLLFFSTTYYLFLKKEDFKGGENLKDYFDYLYFSVVTHASIGYGVISPKTKRAKILVTLHIVLAFTFLVLPCS